MSCSAPTLLCTTNFPANTGFAWDFIEGLYARVADHLATHGITTLVAYPSIPSFPKTLVGSAARPIELDTSLNSLRSVEEVTSLIRREAVRGIYFTDRPARHWAYAVLRLAGVGNIMVHDHSSGEWTRPHGLKRVAKLVAARIPGIVANRVIAVSQYVARRQIEKGLIPAARVQTIWNGISLPEEPDCAAHPTHAIFGLDPRRPLIACACRAAPEKGVVHLLRAFVQVRRTIVLSDRMPVLVFIGDGPQLPELRALRDTLPSKEDVILAGYREDARQLLAGADICVVPSVWQDAFPLAVLEAMALGKPVVATRVGGIPEMIEDGNHGLVVPPGDEGALASAIQTLLEDPAKGRELGGAARARVARHFTPERQLRQLLQVIEGAFREPCDSLRESSG